MKDMFAIPTRRNTTTRGESACPTNQCGAGGRTLVGMANQRPTGGKVFVRRADTLPAGGSILAGAAGTFAAAQKYIVSKSSIIILFNF